MEPTRTGQREYDVARNELLGLLPRLEAKDTAAVDLERIAREVRELTAVLRRFQA